MTRMAHRDISRRRNNPVAFGAKRTFSKPRLQNQFMSTRPNPDQPNYLFTASLRRLLGEKRGRFAALIFIGAPVCG